MAVRVTPETILIARAKKAGILADPVEEGPLAGRSRSSRPPAKKRKIEGIVAEAVERGRALLVGDTIVNGHHFPSELAGAWIAAHKMLHEEDPDEAIAEWGAIVSAARRVLVEYLDGDFERALDLIRWTLKRRHESKSERRLSWRSVFYASNVTDFKVATR